MTIRTATLHDFPSLYSLWQKEVWVYPMEDEKIRYEGMLQHHPELCFVLEDDNKTIFGSVFGAFDGRTVTIHRLVVRNDVQKQGYGKKLLQILEEAAKKRGIKKISGKVHQTNLQVLGFYKKLGYEEDAVITIKKSI